MFHDNYAQKFLLIGKIILENLVQNNTFETISYQSLNKSEKKEKDDFNEIKGKSVSCKLDCSYLKGLNISITVLPKMWTIYKAFYVKNGPLDEFKLISIKMNQQFFWKIGHYEDISWEHFHATDIIQALQVYVFKLLSVIILSPAVKSTKPPKSSMQRKP
jgi:hypothetical protein